MAILLYTRRGCGLCAAAEDVVTLIRPDAAIVDVDGDPGLAARFGLRVPVVEMDGRVVLEGRFDERAAAAALAAGRPLTGPG